MMIDEQSRVIKNMTEDLEDPTADQNETKDIHHPIEENTATTSDSSLVSACKKVKSINFRQLYQKALDEKKIEDTCEDDEEDDDNDSFITITTSDEESDFTLENSESSDSGIIEHDFDTHGSYGINPMFSKASKDHMSTSSRACTEFVFLKQREETEKSSSLRVIKKADGLSSQMVMLKKCRIASSERSMRKIVISNDASPMIVNESCLI